MCPIEVLLLLITIPLIIYCLNFWRVLIARLAKWACKKVKHLVKACKAKKYVYCLNAELLAEGVFHVGRPLQAAPQEPYVVLRRTAKGSPLIAYASSRVNIVLEDDNGQLFPLHPMLPSAVTRTPINVNDL
uniref:ORF4a n=1 Tax=Steinernema glaseri TaxID=37863 RepID=A0A1I7YJ43_9BILA